MRKQLFKGIVCILIVLLVLLTGTANPVQAENDTIAEVTELIDDITIFQQTKTGADSTQDWLSGALAADAGVSSEWYVIGLRQYQDPTASVTCDFSAYQDALSTYLSSHTITSDVSRQKYALALLAASGDNRQPFIAATMADSIGQQGLMSWIFGLHLLNNGCSGSSYSSSDVIAELLSRQLTDGGWALTGNISDVDVTAMTIQALAPSYDSNSTVQTAVDQALELLAAKQQTGGDYSSFGVSNPESTAQVIIALAALGIDLQSDSRFSKDGHTLLDGLLHYRLPDGSFCHTDGKMTNATATAQAYLALVAWWRLQNGYGSIYEFTFAPAVSVPTESAAGSAAPETSTAENQSAADPSPTTADTHTDTGALSYKVWACLIIVSLAFVLCLILWLLKRRHPKNYLLVIIIATAAVGLVLFTNIQSTAQYYRDASTTEAETAVSGTVTLTIRCDTIVAQGRTAETSGTAAYIPADGVILPVTDFAIAQGDTVYDVLVKAAQKFNIPMENSGSGLGLTYICGINYLYEFAYGDLSGWVYRVNGSSPSVNCSDYVLQDGEQIEWLYTCAVGNDL